MTETTRRFAAFLALLFVAGCVDDTTGGGPAEDAASLRPDHVRTDAAAGAPALHDAPPWAIAVVGTDYLSTSISIVDRESRTLFRENVLHSGSTSPGLSVALSGDVVIPAAHDPQNRIVLMDRYPNSVLTFVSPEDFSVVGQLSVSTGFASNPHDYLWLSEHKAYVTRYERNPAPGAEANDGGDDVLVVDPTELRVTGRIPLDDHADATLQARPDRMAWIDGTVWVSLNHVGGDFENAGEGRLVAIDADSDEVTTTLALPDVANCSDIRYAASRNALYVSCSGLFAAGIDEQRARSAIVRVDLGTEPPEVSVLRSAAEGCGRPFGFDLDLSQERWLLAVRFGDLDEEIPDRLVAIDLDDGSEHVVREASSAFGLGGVLVDDEHDTLYIGDADPETPGLHLYRVSDGAFTPDGVIDTHPTVGLPPRCVRFY